VRCYHLQASLFLGACPNVAPGVARGLRYLLVGQGLAMRTLLTSYGLFVSLLVAVAVMAATAFVLNAPASLMTAVLVLGALPRFWNISCVQTLWTSMTLCRSGLRFEASLQNRVKQETIA